MSNILFIQNKPPFRCDYLPLDDLSFYENMEVKVFTTVMQKHINIIPIFTIIQKSINIMPFAYSNNSTLWNERISYEDEIV